MQRLRPLLASVVRSLAEHLDRLRHTFDSLRERLKESVALAVGQAAAGVVREAVHAALGDPAPGPLLPDRAWSPTPVRSLWDRPDRWDQEEELSDPWADEPAEEEDEPYSTSSVEPSPSQRPGWLEAIGTGPQVAGWLLRRPVGRCTVLGAVGIGVASSLAAFLGGPGLVTSALSLLALADTVRSGAAALAWTS